MSKKAVSEAGAASQRSAKSKKSTVGQEEGEESSAVGKVGGQLLGGLTSGAGMLAGGVSSVGGALNPLQLLDGGKKKKRKDTRQYRSRNDIVFEDLESQDEGSESDEDEEKKQSKLSLSYLKKMEANLMKEVDRNKAMMEVEQQKLALGANADQDVKPNKRFKNFNDVFSGLTRSKNVVTNHPIVSCIITYDSKSAITVTKEDDTEYMVKQYSLENYISSFEEKFSGTYIKMS